MPNTSWRDFSKPGGGAPVTPLSTKMERHDLTPASVEQSAQKRTVPSSPISVAMMVVVMTGMTFVPMTIVVVISRLRGRRRWSSALIRAGLCPARTGLVCQGSFDDFVEFAAVQPDTTAFRAIVDLDTLTFTHKKVHAAERAKESDASVCCLRSRFGHFWSPRKH